MDERTLYQTLAEAPDDEGHCVVFADWLLERGDPMAEFLALQLKHHRKPLDKLRAQRAQDLLIMNWKRWTGELHRVIHRRACVFERGFLRVAEARVTERTPLEAITDAPQWATVRTLTVNGPGEVVSRLLESPWLTNLKHLACPGDALAREAAFAFRLERLTLTGPSAGVASPNPAWSELSLLTVEDFVPSERFPLTARELRCTAGTIDGAISIIRGWMAAPARPRVVFVDAHRSTFRLEGRALEVALGPVDRPELAALERLKDLDLEVRWVQHAFTRPADRLDW